MVMSHPLFELLLVFSSPQRDPGEGNVPLSDWSKAPEDYLAVVQKQEYPVHKNVSEDADDGRKVGMRLFVVFLDCFYVTCRA